LNETKMRVPKGSLSSVGRGGVMSAIAVLVVTMSEPPLVIAGSAAPASKGAAVASVSLFALRFL
jgi:hypothetical protein